MQQCVGKYHASSSNVLCKSVANLRELSADSSPCCYAFYYILLLLFMFYRLHIVSTIIANKDFHN